MVDRESPVVVNGVLRRFWHPRTHGRQHLPQNAGFEKKSPSLMSLEYPHTRFGTQPNHQDDPPLPRRCNFVDQSNYWITTGVKSFPAVQHPAGTVRIHFSSLGDIKQKASGRSCQPRITDGAVHLLQASYESIRSV